MLKQSMDNAIESKLINNVLVTLNSLKSFIKQIVHAQSSLDPALKNIMNIMKWLLVVEKQMSTLEKNTHLGFWADSSKQEIIFFTFKS